MNAFFNINKCAGLCFGVALLGFGLYKGFGVVAEARNDVVKTGRKRFEKRLRESADSLAPGLDGEYPADGPLADYYRQQRMSGENWVPVGK
jgi:hypothetical protein